MINLRNGRIYNEDCIKTIDRMDSGEFNLVITSPPYNNSRQSGTMKNHERRYVDFDDNMTNDEYLLWTNDIFNKLDEKMAENGVILYNMSYGGENPNILYLTLASIIQNTNFMIADTIIWKKKSALPNNVSPNKVTRITEFVFVICRKNEYGTFQANKVVKSRSRTGQKYYENVFNFFEASNNDGSTKVNKATFSSEFVQELISRYARKGDVIYDPFMGTGTTALVAEKEGLKYIGSEISEIQCKFMRNERLLEYVI